MYLIISIFKNIKTIYCVACAKVLILVKLKNVFPNKFIIKLASQFNWFYDGKCKKTFSSSYFHFK
jgi:hypothetical protein